MYMWSISLHTVEHGYLGLLSCPARQRCHFHPKGVALQLRITQREPHCEETH